MATPWTARVWREFRCGNLTRAWRDVLLTLETFRGRGGLICPAHQTLADRASLRTGKTAERALAQARDLGLVEWSERRVRRGWRWLRTSNAYRLMVPPDPAQAGQRWPRRTNRPLVGGGESIDKKEAQQGHQAQLRRMMVEAAGMPDLLAVRRTVIENRLRGFEGFHNVK